MRRRLTKLLFFAGAVAIATTRAFSFDVNSTGTAVLGLHDGRCGRARVAQVVRAINSLSPSEFLPKRPCKCGIETHAGLVRIAMENDQYAKGDMSLRYNVLLVTPTPPIGIPMPKMRRSVMAEELLISAKPHTGQSIVWVGYRLNEDQPLTFVAYRLNDDRFRLGEPGQECSSKGR